MEQTENKSNEVIMTGSGQTNRKKNISGKIIGAVIILLCLFLLLGRQLTTYFILPNEYKEKMFACLNNTEFFEAADIKTAEGKICACATDPLAGAVPLPTVSSQEMNAWTKAKSMFFKEAKEKFQLPATPLACEVYDAVKSGIYRQ